jgi:tetratricopeptide (TPR) repeat protein
LPAPRVIAAAVIALAASSAAAPAAAPLDLDPVTSGPSPWYVSLVERYRSGDREAAVSEEAPPEKFRYEIEALARLVAAARRRPTDAALRRQLEAVSLEAAVLLHTDRALQMIERYDPAGPAELDLPPRLVALMEDPARNAFEPRWLRATALELSHVGQWDLALKLLDPASKRYPRDPELLLVRGAVLESMSRLERHATVEYQRVTSSGLRRDTTEAGARQARERLQRAETCYREALAERPDLLHARVRLGRVLQLRGKAEASIAELQAVVEADVAMLDAREVYLAHLFLGYAREQSGQLDRAAADYERAVRALPDGQAAAVALSHALHRLGRWPASAETLQSGVARAGRRLLVDPWWPYVAGQAEDPAALFEVLRAEVSR